MKRHHWILGIISTALLLSLAANYFLFQRYRSTYARVQEVQLNPLHMDFYSTTSPFDQDSDRAKVLFFGDSRAWAWNAPSGMAHLQFANRGIGGHTTAQCLGRYEAHVAALDPDILVIQMGINDLKAIPLFPDQEQTIQDNCLKHIQEQVTMARDSGILVILSTIFPVGDLPLARRAVWSPKVDQSVAEVNQQLIDWAKSDSGIVILESVSVLAGAEGHVRPEFQQDFLHVNPQAYEELNQALIKILSELSLSI